MSDPMRLPDDVLWQGDGHLSSTALSVVADGETELLSPDALSHLEDCQDCTTRLGEGALLSVSTGKALAAVARQAVEQQVMHAAVVEPAKAVVVAMPAPVRRRPLPWLAMVAALFVAVCAALLPLGGDGGTRVSRGADDVAWFATRGVPVAARAAVSISKDAPPWLSGTWLPWGTAGLLVLVGFVVAWKATWGVRGVAAATRRST